MKELDAADIGITAGDLVDKTFPEPDYLLGRWLALGTLSMLFAWRGVGKTFVAMQIGHAVATGTPFLGWKPGAARKVLYIDGEMGESLLQNRLIKIDSSAGLSMESEQMKFLTFEHVGGIIWNLADMAHQAWYSEAATDYELIIIDNLSTCLRPIGRETELQAWVSVQQWAIRERNKGKAIIFIHHAGKTGTQRGVSAREDALDAVIQLKHKEGYTAKEGCKFELWFDKARHFWGEDAKPLEVELLPLDDGMLKWIFRDVDLNKVETSGKTSLSELFPRKTKKEVAQDDDPF